MLIPCYGVKSVPRACWGHLAVAKHVGSGQPSRKAKIEYDIPSTRLGRVFKALIVELDRFVSDELLL